MGLKDIYQTKIRNKLIENTGIKNILALPRLDKVTINVGLGEALVNKKVIESAIVQINSITGQRGVVTKARKDISTFKLRKDAQIGLKVTLRNKKMFDFCEKLFKIVLPRIRDFRGVSKTGFDKAGNYTLGIREQIVFPEIEYSTIDKMRGMEITFVIRNSDKEKSKLLLTEMGLPFEK